MRGKLWADRRRNFKPSAPSRIAFFVFQKKKLTGESPHTTRSGRRFHAPNVRGQIQSLLARATLQSRNAGQQVPASSAAINSAYVNPRLTYYWPNENREELKRTARLFTSGFIEGVPFDEPADGNQDADATASGPNRGSAAQT